MSYGWSEGMVFVGFVMRYVAAVALGIAVAASVCGVGGALVKRYRRHKAFADRKQKGARRREQRRLEQEEDEVMERVSSGFLTPMAPTFGAPAVTHFLRPRKKGADGASDDPRSPSNITARRDLHPTDRETLRAIVNAVVAEDEDERSSSGWPPVFFIPEPTESPYRSTPKKKKKTTEKTRCLIGHHEVYIPPIEEYHEHGMTDEQIQEVIASRAQSRKENPGVTDEQIQEAIAAGVKSCKEKLGFDPEAVKSRSGEEEEEEQREEEDGVSLDIEYYAECPRRRRRRAGEKQPFVLKVAEDDARETGYSMFTERGEDQGPAPPLSKIQYEEAVERDAEEEEAVERAAERDAEEAPMGLAPFDLEGIDMEAEEGCGVPMDFIPLATSSPRQQESS